jgi:hypothetical protein
MIQKEVSFLEEAGFLFNSKQCTNPRSLFRDEPSTSSNFQVPSTCRLDVIRPTDANIWPTSHCGKKVRRPSMFKLMQQHTNNWDADKLLIPSSPPLVDVQALGYGQI